MIDLREKRYLKFLTLGGVLLYEIRRLACHFHISGEVKAFLTGIISESHLHESWPGASNIISQIRFRSWPWISGDYVKAVSKKKRRPACADRSGTYDSNPLDFRSPLHC
jgi:hypothetical protein